MYRDLLNLLNSEGITNISSDVYDNVYANSVDYTSFPSSNSEYNFNYTGTEMSIKMFSSIAQFFSYCSIFVDDVFYQKADWVDNDSYVDIILPEGFKKITIKTGALSKPSILLGCKITSIMLFENQYSKIIEGDVSSKLQVIGDSITVGDTATNTNTLSYAGRLALDNPTIVHGWGYGKLSEFASSESLINDTVSKFVNGFVNCTGDKKLLIALGTNDYGLTALDATTFETYYNNFIIAIKSAIPDVLIYCVSPLLRNVETQLILDYRIAIEQVCLDNSVTYISGPDIMPNNATYFANAVHPNDFGHLTYYNALKAIMYI